MTKIAKGAALNGILLSVILGFYGWRLVREALELHQETSAIIVAQNTPLGFEAASGIDIFNKRVVDSNRGRTVAFLLRGDTVDADLGYWRRVGNLLPKATGLHLVGYCDGDLCVSGVRRQFQSIDFPVIAFGEIVSSQALLNADRDGDAILRIGSRVSFSRIPWRTPSETPEKLVKEVIQ